MKLINDFFEIVVSERSEREFRSQIKFNPAHYIYHAHFPGNPVTPGVCLIQIAGEILETECNMTLLLSMIKNIKFKKIVTPVDTPYFIFKNIVNDGDKLNADVVVADDHHEYVKMSLIFTLGINSSPIDMKAALDEEKKM